MVGSGVVVEVLGSSFSSIKTKEEYSSCKAIPTTFLDVRVTNSRKRKKAGNCIMFKA